MGRRSSKKTNLIATPRCHLVMINQSNVRSKEKPRTRTQKYSRESRQKGILQVKFVARRTHEETTTKKEGNQERRTSSLPRAPEAVVQGLDCLPVSFHSELRARESYPKLRRRKRHFASLQDLHDGRRLVIEDGAHRRADRNLEETPPSVGVRRGVRRCLGHLRDDQHAGTLKCVQEVHVVQGDLEVSRLLLGSRGLWDARMVAEDDIRVGSRESIQFHHNGVQLLPRGVRVAFRQPRMRNNEPVSIHVPTAPRSVNIIPGNEVLHARDALPIPLPPAQRLDLHRTDLRVVEHGAPTRVLTTPHVIFHRREQKDDAKNAKKTDCECQKFSL